MSTVLFIVFKDSVMFLCYIFLYSYNSSFSEFFNTFSKIPYSPFEKKYIHFKITYFDTKFRVFQKFRTFQKIPRSKKVRTFQNNVFFKITSFDTKFRVFQKIPHVSKISPVEKVRTFENDVFFKKSRLFSKKYAS